MSKAQIFNIALNILGVSNPIENTNSEDNRAILLNNYYTLARDYVLKDFDWNFASTFKELALCENPPFNKYSFCYSYPNDCICARDIFEKGSYKIEKFEIATYDTLNKVIITNTKNAFLRYTKRIEKETQYSVEFEMALAHYLASLTSNVITGSVQKGEIAYEKYKQILKRAKVLNAQEGTQYTESTETYLDTRS